MKQRQAVELIEARSEWTGSPNLRLISNDDAFEVRTISRSDLSWNVETPWGDELTVITARKESGLIAWAVIATTEDEAAAQPITVIQGTAESEAETLSDANKAIQMQLNLLEGLYDEDEADDDEDF